MLTAGLLVTCDDADSDRVHDAAVTSAPVEEQVDDDVLDFTRVEGVTTTEAHEAESSVATWFERVPEAQEVLIPSDVDGAQQPAMWVPPSDHGLRPLLVVLHSWGARYDQGHGIPFGQWAGDHGWAMIHPDFRGPFETPEATGSDLAVADVLAAVDFAIRQGNVDAERVFLVGYSGGGMMSLLVAGRHPERFAGAVAWVPIHNLVVWHRENAERGTYYVSQIEASCGGDPSINVEARDDCLHRSPVTHLDSARDAGLPVYIGHGAGDTSVPPHHGVAAFNQLASPEDRLGVDFLGSLGVAGVDGVANVETHFAEIDPPVLAARTSGAVTLVLFDGGHDMVFHPGLAWMVDLLRQDPRSEGEPRT